MDARGIQADPGHSEVLVGDLRGSDTIDQQDKDKL